MLRIAISSHPDGVRPSTLRLEPSQPFATFPEASLGLGASSHITSREAAQGQNKLKLTNVYVAYKLFSATVSSRANNFG